MIPPVFSEATRLADPHWRPVLMRGLEAVHAADPDYLPALARDDYLPTRGRLFAAFAQPLETIRYVLVGEGPYPREESATGVCFMDGAVKELWSPQGLSKSVNRATSLRNFMKMLLVAEGLLQPDNSGGSAIAAIAARAMPQHSGFIHTLPELQDKLHQQGFLLLNAALVFRPAVPPVKEARAWRPLLEMVLESLAGRTVQPAPTLVLWGKIAAMLDGLPAFSHLPRITAEHPYNLSFILNRDMQQLFGPMHLLRSTA